ncbi:S-adenosylmethionine:tRNA ribosyltransferase-isomerase, partial [Micrococcus sp. SIMBA_144]
IERILEPTRALAHVRASKSPRPGTTLIFDGDVRCQVTARHEDLFELQFEADILPVLDRHGNLPLPPYIKHSADQEDETRYQTVYAR